MSKISNLFRHSCVGIRLFGVHVAGESSIYQPAKGNLDFIKRLHLSKHNSQKDMGLAKNISRRDMSLAKNISRRDMKSKLPKISLPTPNPFGSMDSKSPNPFGSMDSKSSNPFGSMDSKSSIASDSFQEPRHSCVGIRLFGVHVAGESSIYQPAKGNLDFIKRLHLSKHNSQKDMSLAKSISRRDMKSKLPKISLPTPNPFGSMDSKSSIASDSFQEPRHSCAGRNPACFQTQTGLSVPHRHSCAGRNLKPRHTELVEVRILFITIILLSIFLTSCTDFVSGERFTQAHYTLNALLKSGTTITQENPVIICKMVNLSQLNEPDMYISEATVIIREFQKNPASPESAPVYDILTKQFALQQGLHQLDSLRIIPCFYDPAGNLIQPDYKYHIEINIPGYDKVISADTIVPKAAQLVPNFNYTPPAGQGFTTDPADTVSSIPYPLVDQHYPVTIKVDGYQSINYMVELYCREEFSTDLEFTTVFMGQEHPTQDVESNYYQASGETIRRINIMANFVSRQHTDGNWYVSLTDYRQAFVFYGRYQITAYVLDDNYFKYKYMPEGYYYGGVKNAFGCFGSAGGGTMYTKIIR
jgi:hypothetical protein